MNEATPPTTEPKPAPQFVPPRYDDFAASNEDKAALHVLKAADRQLAHAEQELRGALDSHRRATEAHTKAATDFAATPGGHAYHEAAAQAWAQHTEALKAHSSGEAKS